MINTTSIYEKFRKAIRSTSKSAVVEIDGVLDQKIDFGIQRLEDIFRHAGSTIPPLRFSQFRIVFIKTGRGDYLTGICKFKAKPNTLVVIPSRVISSSRNWSADTTGYLLAFSSDFFIHNNLTAKFVFDRKIMTSSFQPNISLNASEGKDIGDIMEKLIAEFHNNFAQAEQLIAVKLIELLIVTERLFAEHIDFKHNQPSIDIANKFNTLVEKNYAHHHAVSFYASELNIHPNYLNSVIKKQSGCTAKESIRNRLLLEAKYLLVSTSHSIKEISHELGFRDPNYFTTFFRQLESTTPALYRAAYN